MEGSSLLGNEMEWEVNGGDSIKSLAYIRIPSNVCVEFDDGFCPTAILRLVSIMGVEFTLWNNSRKSFYRLERQGRTIRKEHLAVDQFHQ